MKRLMMAGGALLLLLAAACGGDDSSEQVDEHYKLGFDLMEAGEYQQAIAEFDQVIALDPNLAKAYSMRGVSRWELSGGDVARIEAALVDLDRAVEVDASQFIARYTRALAYSVLERYEDAVTEFEAALSMAASQATQADIAYRRALALIELGRGEDARIALDAALAMTRDSQFRDDIRAALESLEASD